MQFTARLHVYSFTMALFGGLPLFGQEVIHNFTGSTGDSYGQVCDIVGDTDFDGRAEVMVGAWRDDIPGGGGSDAGSVFVYDGATGALVQNVYGTGAGDHMGYGSSSAGDANGDGIFDICAAADEDNTGAGTNVGSAAIVDGATGAVLWLTEGDSTNDLYGWSTAAAGDVDNDGFDDCIIGALLDDGGAGGGNAGSITVISGATGTVIHKVFGDVASGNLGANVGKVGDVNGDGFADFAGTRGSRVYVYSGADASLLYDLANGGASPNGKVSGGVDVNLDGFDDIILGEASSNSGRGRVRAISGADGTIIHQIFGDAGDGLGASVFGAGDLNGDGYEDFVAGSPNDDVNGSNSGSLKAFSGKDGTLISEVGGGGGNRRMGQACGGGHDINGDGVNDCVASATTSARAWAVSFVPTGVVPFGTGTPGCAGPQGIGTNGQATVGNAGFAIHSSNSAPNAPAFLAMSSGSLPMGVPVLGVLAHIDPTVPFFQLLVTPAADANGSLEIPIAVPNDPTQAGNTFSFQVATFWPGGSCTNLSTSRGMSVTIQP